MKRLTTLMVTLIVIPAGVAAGTLFDGRDGSDASAGTALPDPGTYARTIRSSAPGEQRAALQDGVVTLDEYSGAVNATAECAAAAHVAISVAPAVGQRPPSLSFHAPTLVEADAARVALDGCKAVHLTAIETTWALQQAQQPAARVEAAHRLASECIQTQGVAIDDGFLSVEDLNALMLKREKMTEADRALFTAYSRCRATVAEQLGYELP